MTDHTEGYWPGFNAKAERSRLWPGMETVRKLDDARAHWHAEIRQPLAGVAEERAEDARLQAEAGPLTAAERVALGVAWAMLIGAAVGFCGGFAWVGL
jgi:hypothetical protein